MTAFRLTTAQSVGRIAAFSVLVGAALIGAYAFGRGAPDEAPGATAALRTAVAAPPPHFKAHQKLTQWRAPRLVGVEVFDGDGKPVGRVEDVLMTHDGVAETVVVGVGGILGVGVKSVAVPFAAIHWGMTGRHARNPAPGAAAPSGLENAEAAQGHPDEAEVTATLAEFQSAPAFAYAASGPVSGALSTDDSPYR